MDAPTGPIDVVFVGFSAARSTTGSLPITHDPPRQSPMRVLDLLLVFRKADGSVGVADLRRLKTILGPDLTDLVGRVPDDRRAPEDAHDVAPGLAHGSSILVVVMENLSASPFDPAAHTDSRDGAVQSPAGATLVSVRIAGAELPQTSGLVHALGQAARSADTAADGVGGRIVVEAAPAAVEGDHLTRWLRKLVVLHDHGVLSEAEFAAAKAQALGA